MAERSICGEIEEGSAQHEWAFARLGNPYQVAAMVLGLFQYRREGAEDFFLGEHGVACQCQPGSDNRAHQHIA
jgi:hypothetical protein